MPPWATGASSPKAVSYTHLDVYKRQDMKFELLLSHWLRVTNIIYAALSSGVLAAVLAFPEFRRILFQSWLVVTDVFQLFLIILLFILLSKIAQLNRIRNGWRNEKRKEKDL